MPKANADYDRLHRHAVADRDHFKARLSRTEAELRDLLKDVPGGAAILKMAEAHGMNLYDFTAASESVERYERLIAKQNSASEPEPEPEPAPAPEPEPEPEPQPAGKSGRK